MADLILLAVGLVVGAVGTLVGAGGGFLLVPVLLFLYPDDPPGVVTATSLAVVFVNSVSGSVAYAYQRRIDYRSGLILAVATVPGSVAGALLTHRMPRGLFTLGFSAVLVAIAVLLVRRPAARERTGGDPTAGQRRVLVDRLGQIYVYSLPLARAIPISAGIGLLSSLLGIGGGFIQVPVFILVFGFPTYIATATSQFMLAVMSFSGTLTHALTGEVGEAGRRTLILAPGVIIGAQFGAWLSRRMRPAAIARLLAVLLILVAVRTVVGQLLG
jgi:uncharacterized membrane protein YfcA